MKHFDNFARCLTLLLAALILSGMLAVAEPAAPSAADASSRRRRSPKPSRTSRLKSALASP